MRPMVHSALTVDPLAERRIINIRGLRTSLDVILERQGRELSQWSSRQYLAD